MDMLGRAVSSNLAFKMMALLEEPKTHKLWLHKAGQFYNAAIHMKKLQEGTQYIPSDSGSKKNTRDPMAMDIDRIYLTPVQRAEHICNNKCFICHKVGCSTRNHPGTKRSAPIKTYLPQNQQPHNVRNTTNTTPVSKKPPTQPIDKVASYLNVMHTNKNLSNQDVL